MEQIDLLNFIPEKVISGKNKIIIPKEKLILLYIKNKKSTSDIAKIYNCNPETIRRRLIEYKIKRRDSHEKKFKITRNYLELEYNKNKLSSTQIAKKIGCSQWTICSNLNKYKIKIRDCNDYHKWKSVANQIKPNLKNKRILSYILGVIKGDGFVYKRGYCYFVGLDSSDKEFSLSFLEALKKVNLNPSMFLNKKGYWRTIGSSKLFYKWYKSLNFKQIKQIAFKYPKEFIRGFYESEGCYHMAQKKYSRIIIVNTDERLIKLVKKLIENLGFKTNLYQRPQIKSNWKRVWALTMYNKEEIKKFLKEINPCIKLSNSNYLVL